MSSHNTFRVARHVAMSAIAVLAIGATAHADDATTRVGGHQTVIRMHDLDLSQDADVRKLYSRLRRAADSVCEQIPNDRDLRAKRLYKECYQDTLARAVKSVGNSALTAMHAADDRIRVAGRRNEAEPNT